MTNLRVKGPEQMGGAYCLRIARDRFCLTPSASKIYSSSTVNTSDKSPGVLEYIYVGYHTNSSHGWLYFYICLWSKPLALS